jgi:hypothetical protein
MISEIGKRGGKRGARETRNRLKPSIQSMDVFFRENPVGWKKQ